jgi:hypothetical protein
VSPEQMLALHQAFSLPVGAYTIRNTKET